METYDLIIDEIENQVNSVLFSERYGIGYVFDINFDSMIVRCVLVNETPGFIEIDREDFAEKANMLAIYDQSIKLFDVYGELSVVIHLSKNKM